MKAFGAKNISKKKLVFQNTSSVVHNEQFLTMVTNIYKIYILFKKKLNFIKMTDIDPVGVFF